MPPTSSSILVPAFSPILYLTKKKEGKKNLRYSLEIFFFVLVLNEQVMHFTIYYSTDSLRGRIHPHSGRIGQGKGGQSRERHLCGAPRVKCEPPGARGRDENR